MTIYFCRHGETQWNQLGVLQGHLDSQLTALGIQQSMTLAHNTRALDIEVIVASDLGRAQQTAQIVSQTLGCEIHFDSDLRERAFGDLQGYRRDQSPTGWHLYDKRYQADKLAITGAESASQVALRIHHFLTHISEQYKGKNLLIIGHGEWLRILNNIVHNQASWSNNSHRIPDNCELILFNSDIQICA